MPVSTASAAVHITPVVFKTLFRHTKRKGQKLKNEDETEEATDDLLYDEAFHIVKSFIELGTRNTVESLQEFTNTHVPAPYWAAVSPVIIPLPTCNKAADLLVEWFPPEDLKYIVGGKNWWQVRGLDGLDAEWITEKEYLDDAKPPAGQKLSSSDEDILRMNHLDTVMLYVHGGGYYWGSINTHRYQIIRYARKMKGRAFAVNYRKAPQYPWPCPLHDVLSAYLYLTSPPADALHKPVPPSKIVFAGDSAGAGLCLVALTVLRDLGLQQPAGAVLISPWVDMTHSFPSVMQNTESDIIPPHGFIHKHSPLWPVELVPKEGRARVIPTQTNPPPKPGHADTLQPSAQQLGERLREQAEAGKAEGRFVHAEELKERDVKDQAAMLQNGNGGNAQQQSCQNGVSSTVNKDNPASSRQSKVTSESEVLDFWEPKPPKVLMKDPHSKPLELRSQIQLYATNEQLTHPLVSPVLQGSLGNLCTLYILAGDGEVLRDEIIYLAHKAANPREYPTRKGILKESARQRENAEKYQTSTKVHLQVFDGMCHVLTVFTFTPSAKYAYRSIAEFVKHVTQHTAEHLDRNPFPELHRPPSQISDPPSSDDENHTHLSPRSSRSKKRGTRKSQKESKNGSPDWERPDVNLYRQNEDKVKEEVKNENVQFVEQGKAQGNLKNTNSASRDIPGVRFIRERVDIFGQVRTMEDKDQIPALQVPSSEIGVIKEEPVTRWLAGQQKWDHKYKRAAHKAERRRKHYEKKAAKLIVKARHNGLLLGGEAAFPSRRMSTSTTRSNMSRTSTGYIQVERRYGPFDLEGERPSPSSIVGRRDTRGSVALIKKHIYHSAPRTHKTVPRIPTSTAIEAAFDPTDHPFKPPKQSVSEEQTYARIIPWHGVRMWQGLVSYFMKKSTKKAEQGKRHAVNTLQKTSELLKTSQSEPEQNSQD